MFDKVRNSDEHTLVIPLYFTRFVIFIICLHYSIAELSRNSQGTLTSAYGRISNIVNEHIHVSASLSLTSCIRQCTDFSLNHLEYPSEECFAYNYDMRKYTCELIHSTEPLAYLESFQTQWMTGYKFQS